MLNLTPQQTGELLAKWLMKMTAPDAVASWGRDIGFDNAPLFGAAKRHARLYEEVALLHGSIALFAVEQSLPLAQMRAVVNAFSAVAHAVLFPAFEQDPAFRGRWVARREHYLRLLRADRQAVGVSLAFMQYLGLDPLKNLRSQVACAARIAQAAADAQGVLGHVRLQRPRSTLDAFEERIRGWPEAQAESARRLFRALRDGAVAEASTYYDRLTVAQSREVHEVFEELDQARRR